MKHTGALLLLPIAIFFIHSSAIATTDTAQAMPQTVGSLSGTQLKGPSPSTPHPANQHEESQNRTAQKRPNPESNPSINHQQIRNKTKQFLYDLKKKTPSKQPLTPKQQDHKSRLLEQKHINKIEDMGKVKEILKQNRPNGRQWFAPQSYENHHYQPLYHIADVNSWNAPPHWIIINNWVSGNWNHPIYYDDGGYPLELPSEILNSYPMPQLAPQEGNNIIFPSNEWLPLGVFAVSKNVTETSFTHMFIQLAVDKKGDIAGTYYNESTDQMHPLVGIVDRDTQQAAWTVADKPNSPLIVTGIYDLTQDIAPIQVHYQEGSVQNWILVRLNQ